MREEEIAKLSKKERTQLIKMMKEEEKTQFLNVDLDIYSRSLQFIDESGIEGFEPSVEAGQPGAAGRAGASDDQAVSEIQALFISVQRGADPSLVLEYGVASHE